MKSKNHFMKKYILFPFLVCSSFGLIHVSALTWQSNWTMSPYYQHPGGSIFTATGNIDKDTYFAGEDIIFSGSITSATCANVIPYREYSVILNGETNFLMNKSVRGGAYNGSGWIEYGSAVVKAPNVPGNYSIRFRPCYYYRDGMIMCTSAYMDILVKSRSACGNSKNKKYVQREIDEAAKNTINLCSVGSIRNDSKNILSKKWSWNCGEVDSSLETCEADMVEPKVDVQIKKVE